MGLQILDFAEKHSLIEVERHWRSFIGQTPEGSQESGEAVSNCQKIQAVKCHLLRWDNITDLPLSPSVTIWKDRKKCIEFVSLSDLTVLRLWSSIYTDVMLLSV